MAKAEFKIYLLQVDKRRKKKFCFMWNIEIYSKMNLFYIPQTKKNRSQSLAIDLNER